jgi:hypothetical protein
MFGIVYSTTVARFPEAIFVLAAALVLVAFGATFLVRNESPRRRKGKAPAVAVVTARRRVQAPERERGRSRAVKHIGDRVRKPASPLVPASNSVSTETSQSTTSSSGSSVGRSDDVV